MPTWSWIRSSSMSIRWRSFRSSAASGSSSSSTSGWFTSARATATRCFWPPLIWSGRLWACPSIWMSASIRSTASSISRRERRATRSPKPMFSRTVRWGKRA